MNKPCPYCGHQETQEDEERHLRQKARIVAEEFIKGRQSIKALSRRENEVIDAVIDLGMSFNEVSESLSINVKTAYFHWGNALKKINNL
jgi:DNA-binding CsgD family transcriptional regulator